ncbi:MAG: oligosaccharide flippase family protein [Thermoproteota archaeon]|nr:oligosaccharide flippase family protein [Thermoproteota archaeon]
MQDEIDNNSLSYRTARGTLIIFIQNLVVGISASLFFMFIARFLPTVSDLGLVNGLQSLIKLAVLVAGLGLYFSASRFASYYLGAGREDLSRGVSMFILKTGIVSSAILTIVLVIFASQLSTAFFHSQGYSHLIRLASTDVFLVSVVSLSNYILFSKQGFRIVAIISILNSLVKFPLAFVLLITGMGVNGIFIGMIIADAAAMAITLFVLIPQIRGGSRFSEIKSLIRYSLPLYASNILSLLSVTIDYYLLLALSSLNAAGLYSPAVLIGSVLLMTLAALDQSLLPYFSRMYGKSGINSLKEPSAQISRYIFLIFLPLGFGAMVSAPSLIIHIFGERYAESTYPAVILIGVITITSMGIVFNNILKSSGHSKIMMTSASFALTVQLIISVITIPILGAIGAALARSAGYSLMFLIPAYQLRRLAGLHYDKKALQKGILGSAVMGSIIVVLNSTLYNAYYFPLILLAGFISYLVFLRFTDTMNTRDFEIINNTFSGRLSRPIALVQKIVLNRKSVT